MQINLVLVVHKKLNDNSPLAHAQNANEGSECEDGVSLGILRFQQTLSDSLPSRSAREQELLFHVLFHGNQ